MVYRIHLPDGLLVFSWNCGRLFLDASGDDEARTMARALFPPMREVTLARLSRRQYLIEFRVEHDYRPALLRVIDRAVRTIVNPSFYRSARYIDRYVLACIHRLAGKPHWLALENLREEINELRKASLAAGEVAGIESFRDWDACIANWVEMNLKEGHRSRSIRLPKQPISFPGEQN